MMDIRLATRPRFVKAGSLIKLLTFQEIIFLHIYERVKWTRKKKKSLYSSFNSPDQTLMTSVRGLI